MYTLSQLRRLRLVVFLMVVSGIGSSVAVNVLHAPDNFWAKLISTLPPLAVFGVLELATRIPVSSVGMARVRVWGAAIVAIGAAAISYWQQRSAVIELDFETWEASIWPIIIDGFMIVASVSLYEVAGKIRSMVAEQTDVTTPAKARAAADKREAPEAIQYRAAVEQLRQQSRVAALNGQPVVVAGERAEQSA